MGCARTDVSLKLVDLLSVDEGFKWVLVISNLLVNNLSLKEVIHSIFVLKGLHHADCLQEVRVRFELMN
jgi:hypothetical protein